MKNFLKLFALALVIVMSSCEKEELTKDLTTDEASSTKPEQPGEFKKEIVITDESGNNSLFIAIYSDFESAIDEYLSNIDLKLVTSDTKSTEPISKDLSINNNSEKNDTQDPEIKEEHSVVVEIVRTNLEPSVVEYSLEVNSKMDKSTNFIYGTYASYQNSSDFMGIVHRGTGYWLWVSTNYKKNWYSLSWENVYAGYLDPTAVYYAYVNTYDSYKTAIGVYLDQRQGSQNYEIRYSKDTYYGHDCEMGSYDYNNYAECFVGSAPSGTSAFIYAYNNDPNKKYFFYTPVNGNQCPVSGSVYDGANCRAAKIPVGVTAYTWSTNWLVKSNKIVN